MSAFRRKVGRRSYRNNLGCSCQTVVAGSARPILSPCLRGTSDESNDVAEEVTVVTMFAFVLYTCSSGRVVPPLAARRSPTDEIKKIGVQ